MQTLNLEEQQLAEHWAKFSAEIESLNARLAKELESCWGDVYAILERQLNQLAAACSTNSSFTGLKPFERVRAECAGEYLIEPVAQWKRRRPYKRAMMSIENYDRRLAELIRSLPKSAITTGPTAMRLLGHYIDSNWERRLAELRRNEYRLPMNAIVEATAYRLRYQRARKVEGRFLMSLAEGIQQIRNSWEARRWALDHAAQEGSASTTETEIHRAEVVEGARLARQAESAISDWQAWSESLIAEFGRELGMNVLWRRRIKPVADRELREVFLRHWEEQARSLENELELDILLTRNEDASLKVLQKSLDSLAEERRGLLKELDDFIVWAPKALSGAIQHSSSSLQIDVAPAASRISEVERIIESIQHDLPERIKTIKKFTPLPRPWVGIRELFPAKIARESFERYGFDAIGSAFAAAESQHIRLAQAIEQAREVVAFGLEGGSGEKLEESQIARDALQNAISLLEFQRKEIGSSLADIDLRFLRSLTIVFSETRLVLSRNRLGMVAHLGQESARRGLAGGARWTIDAIERSLQLIFQAEQRAGQRFLAFIGWLPTSLAEEGDVVIRPFLPQEFTIDLESKALPAIYRRLFRFEAVQDPRFLVGRARELEAITDARRIWEAGRPVAVLVIGDRGSGKTSLINCALQRSLEDLDVLRAEFNARITSAVELNQFLAEVIGAPDPEKLAETLAERRRVIILEELERAFLRQIGCYAAIRELQRLISASCGSTLWLVVTNQTAFQFFDAAIDLGHTFSHRLNVSRVSPQSLQEAILLRHHLSGLRLQFSPPPPERGALNRLKSIVHQQQSPEQIFFERLSKESMGVFRAAFEIWLGQIDAVRAGALMMKPITTPDLGPIIDALDQNDLFTLVAVLQHGSLKPEEHAVIFQQQVSSSRAQMDELLAREILEPDPNRPGIRVRPEALRVVQEALYRRNLL